MATGVERAVAAQAFATASDLFASSSDTPELLRGAAEVLATAPGAMCLVSLADDAGLHAYAVAHERPPAERHLRRIVANAPAAAGGDAFSRSVQRSGGSLRLGFNSARLLRLWLPRAYWSYAERARVRGVLAAALARRGHVLGTLLLWREGSQSAYAPADQAYVQALAQRLALAF